MKSIENMQHHPIAVKIVDTLCKKTQSKNRLFFHVLVGYYFAKMASMMRAFIETHDRGDIPVNIYAINLALSGEGKGYSTNIVEDSIINLFKERFLSSTFPVISDKHLEKISLERATRNNILFDDEHSHTLKEFKALGNLAFSFDSGTTAAVKQMRHKLLMANAGSMNMEIDEIGSNLLGNIDVLTTFLELFDIGKVKQKLIKNTVDNIRNEEIIGRTPTNMMLFGTPAKLLNGGKTEEEFYAMLETGFARRCIFGYSKTLLKESELDANEVYNILTDSTSNNFLKDLSVKFSKLASVANFYNKIKINKDTSLILIEYRLLCENNAAKLSDHQEIQKAELCHRYFKALKLAGAYAFIDESQYLTEDHLYNAIKLVEDSGKAFDKLLTRERNYVKLANYIASVKQEVTHVDLVEDLPFYKGSESKKRELMNLAVAYGYKNNIIIKRTITDGIEFLKGESLKENDLTRIIVAYSTQLAEGYKSAIVAFTALPKLVTASGYHWINHHVLHGYRKEDNILTGFNLLVLDVDKNVHLKIVKLLLRDYTYLIYTTKRHTPNENRFRILLPISHNLKLNSNEYKAFMKNIYEWLPFELDEQTNQRSRKWLSHAGTVSTNTGKLLDILPFIPKTSKNKQRQEILTNYNSLNNIERWFILRTNIGNRSNQLIKYAYMLVDMGLNMQEIQDKIFSLNNKLSDSIPEAEILTTIMVTVSKAIVKYNTN